MRITNSAILILILIIATALRFYQYSEIPFTHDEFSALFRTDFGTFRELIEKGVKPDGHPAGIQVFLYYWTKLTGLSEPLVKLPFTLAGIASVFLIYLIARKWYNVTIALITAAYMASLQYTVMYSQIARPYISGLFFTLLMVLFWTRIIRTPKKNFNRNSMFYILSASLCAYNHHFSLLFAVIVGVSGLFLIERKHLLRYMANGFFIILLYLPHLGIFFHQLQTGGIEEWLGKPDSLFIFRFLGYIFQFSVFCLLLAAGIAGWGVYAGAKRERNIPSGKDGMILPLEFNGKRYLLFGCWFFLPILIGFLYSQYVSAVLQYSVLIFSFPFLFFLLFGHIKSQNTKTNLILVSSILVINIFSLISERKHYSLFYDSPFEKVATDHQSVNPQNTVSVIDSHKKMTGYYLTKDRVDTNFVWFDTFINEVDFIRFLKSQSQIRSQIYFGCLSSNNPVNINIIRDYFPNLVWQRNYVGGTTYLFSKDKGSAPVIIDRLGFEAEEHTFWKAIIPERVTGSVVIAGNASYMMDSTMEYSPTWSGKLMDVILPGRNIIDISVKTTIPEASDEIILVASLETDGKSLDWGGTRFEKFIPGATTDEKWVVVHHSLEISYRRFRHKGSELKIYIWNQGKHTFVIDDFTITTREGNPVIYGLNEKI